jgi:SAM-dependent methyltransferase
LDREAIVKEFYRLLKPEGKLSVVKHNRSGRVMQMVVLLNNFENANKLLDGCDGNAEKYGEIHYYEDSDLIKWCSQFSILSIQGMRTFWDLQQNQEIQTNPQWQEKMLQIEERVANIKEYQNIAFFHHLILEKV